VSDTSLLPARAASSALIVWLQVLALRRSPFLRSFVLRFRQVPCAVRLCSSLRHGVMLPAEWSRRGNR
jgi:hypothetical protein